MWEYLLPDALGSVRQIVDANGNVTLAKSYEPYGTVLTSTGTASSSFGYAGEQADTTGLIYLRARYMNPRLGIFLARDPWSGDQLRPGSMNGWNYAGGNPIIRVDPSGRCYPPLEWLRQYEPAQCANLDQALLILGDPRSTREQRAGPGFYVGMWTTSHAIFIVGASIGTLGGVEAWGSQYLMNHPETEQQVGECAGKIWEFLKDRAGALKDAIDGLRSRPDVWQLNPFERGVQIENMLGRSPQLVQNFPVIDRFVNGVATSIKSVDLAASTYQNLNTLANTVQGYVTKLANWQGASWGGFTIHAAEITGRELLLAVPPNASQAQLAILQQVQQWATTVGVNLNITTIP